MKLTKITLASALAVGAAVAALPPLALQLML